MSKEKKKKKAKSIFLSSIDISIFDSNPQLKKALVGLLLIVDKYDGVGVNKIMERFGKGELLADALNLSAKNIFIATLAGGYQGGHARAETLRKISFSVEWVRLKKHYENEDEKYTDRLLSQESETLIKKKRLKEIDELEKAAVLSNLMHRVKELISTLEFVSNALRSEEKASNL